MAKQEYIAPAPPPHVSTNIQFIKEYQRLGHKIDKKLLAECAYYPRGGCQYCRWDWPYPKCEFAHILVTTRCAGVKGWKEDRTAKDARKKGAVKKRQKKQLKEEKFWSALPKELAGELANLLTKVMGEETEDESEN